MDASLQAELSSSLQLDVLDFIPTCFGLVPGLDRLARAVFDQCQIGEVPLYDPAARRWAQWPSDANETDVLAWLKNLTGRMVEWTPPDARRSRQLYCGPKTVLAGSVCERQMDVGIAVTPTDALPIHKWAQILIVGELKCNSAEANHGKAWLDLATYAREVFREQSRRFVLGFTLCGSMMRLWQFDRLGNLASCPFDIHLDGYQFIYVMLGYFIMDDERLGRDTTVGHSPGYEYVDIVRDRQPLERLILTSVIRRSAVIIGRATTCWKAYRDGDPTKSPLVVKDSWQWLDRAEEGELLQHATESGVSHVARYYHHETVQVGGQDDNVLFNVRRNQMKTCGRTRFTQPKAKKRSDHRKVPLATGSTDSGLPLGGLIVRNKRSSSSSNPNEGLLAAKRLRSIPRSIPPGDDNVNTPQNRVHRRVVTRDLGKPIERASSLVALLNGVIGAIQGPCLACPPFPIPQKSNLFPLLLLEMNDKEIHPLTC